MKVRENILKKTIAWILAGALSVGAAAGCGGQQNRQGGPADQGSGAAVQQEEEKNQNPGAEGQTQPDSRTDSKGTIMVTYVKSPLNVPSIVEKDQAIFAEAFGKLGYDVGYSDLTTGPEQTQALASGDIQFLYAVGATSVILAASNGLDIKIISTYSRSPKAFKLFSKDGSIQSPEDLRGKKVAGPKGTILHELLTAYLASGGMNIT